jgi:hypothetical protein
MSSDQLQSGNNSLTIPIIHAKYEYFCLPQTVCGMLLLTATGKESNRGESEVNNLLITLMITQLFLSESVYSLLMIS